jgi:hypothetical protein
MTLEALGTLGRLASVTCEHCGGPRMKIMMRELRHELYRDPSPLLARCVQQLRRLYGKDATIYVCSACSCVTGDLDRHSH